MRDSEAVLEVRYLVVSEAFLNNMETISTPWSGSRTRESLQRSNSGVFLPCCQGDARDLFSAALCRGLIEAPKSV